MVSKRIEELRKSLQRKKKAKAAKERARARDERKGETAQARARRERRIQTNTPESATEKAEASVRESRLLAAELGVTRKKAKAITKRANDTLDKALESGSKGLKALDVDGDGDTDLLSSIDPLEVSLDEPNGNGGSSPMSKSSKSSKTPDRMKALKFTPPMTEAPRGGFEADEINFKADDIVFNSCPKPPKLSEGSKKSKRSKKSKKSSGADSLTAADPVFDPSDMDDII